MTGWELAFTLIGTFVSVAALVTVIFFRTLDRVSANAKWAGQVDADRENFKDFIKEVRGKLDSLFRLVSRGTVDAGSPTRLTDLGREVSDEIGAGEWAKNQAALFARQLQGKQPYESQDFSFDYVFNRHEPEEEELARWKESAYQHGLDISQVKNVLMVELRDALLQATQQSEPTPTPKYLETPWIIV